MTMKVYVLKDHVNGSCELKSSGNTRPVSESSYGHIFMASFWPSRKLAFVKKEKGR